MSKALFSDRFLMPKALQEEIRNQGPALLGNPKHPRDLGDVFNLKGWGKNMEKSQLF